METTMSFIAFLAIYDSILRRITPINQDSSAQTQNDETRGDENNDTEQNRRSISLLLLNYCKHFSFVVLQGRNIKVYQEICNI